MFSKLATATAARVASHPTGLAIIAAAPMIALSQTVLAAEPGDIADKAKQFANDVAAIVDVEQLKKVVAWDRIRNAPRWVKIALACCAGGVLLVKAIKWFIGPQRREGIARTLRFYRTGVPIALAYTWKKKAFDRKKTPQEEREVEYRKMHIKYGPEIRHVIDDLRGCYLKIGQVLATRGDMLPKEICASLKGLLDCVKPHPISEIVKTLEEDLKVPLNDFFLSFNVMPIACASLSQVHHAVLKDGREVVVKIQYEDAEYMMMNDIRTMNWFSGIFQPEMKEANKELAKQIETEFDFVREADNLRKIGNIVKERADIVMPIPVHATRRVLIMTFVPGFSFAQDVREFPARIESLRTMVDVMGVQMLKHGLFNGDPHPGNFLVSSDKQIGLIDFGQVVHMDDRTRYLFAKMIKSMVLQDEKTCFEALFALGYRTKHNKPYSHYMFAKMNFDNGPPPDGMSFIEMFQKITVDDPIADFPKKLLFIFRSAMLIRGMVYGCPFSMAKMWEKYADEALIELAHLADAHQS